MRKLVRCGEAVWELAHWVQGVSVPEFEMGLRRNVIEPVEVLACRTCKVHWIGKRKRWGTEQGSRMGREGELAKTDLSVRGLGGTFACWITQASRDSGYCVETAVLQWLTVARAN